mmetsp:Transcript_2871/g.8745  ORF Transcript_2871/g.8745 Transcript_2871/m.8745 type:complete len:213 (+) Transcript_2871:1225-1863(+)
MVSTSARPQRVRDLRCFTMPYAAALSRPLVRPSHIMMEGLENISTPANRRRFWPPERPFLNTFPTGVSRHVFIPRLVDTRATNSSRSLGSCTPANCAEKSSVSRVVSTPISEMSAGVYDIWLRKFLPRDCPFTRIEPLRRPLLTRSPSASSSVVLPQPEGPMTIRISPGSTAPDTSVRMFLYTTDPAALDAFLSFTAYDTPFQVKSVGFRRS